jgi:thiamine-phosphate pyrophosphorylase
VDIQNFSEKERPFIKGKALEVIEQLKHDPQTLRNNALQTITKTLQKDVKAAMFPPLLLTDWDDSNDYTSLPCGLYLPVSPLLHLHQSIDRIHRIFTAINQLPYQKNMHILQLQTEELSEKDIIICGETLLDLCRYHGIVFIIDSHPELAHTIGADGIYLNQPEQVNADYIGHCRNIMGEEKIIGINCGNSRQIAMMGNQENVDFVLFENFFSTTHPKATASLLAWWSTCSPILSVAKGNITEDNCADIVTAGINFLCCDPYLWHDPQFEQKIISLMKIIAHTIDDHKTH